jgi:hypothetical protein
MVVGAITWTTIEDPRPIHIRLQAGRSAAIGYGTLCEDTKRPRIVIKDIWKRSSSGRKLAVGDVIAVPAAADSARPVKLHLAAKFSAKEFASRQGYAEVKSEFIDRITRLARACGYPRLDSASVA